MASVYRNSYTRKGQKVLLDRWYIKYRDETGKIRRIPGFADREATEKLAQSLAHKISNRLADRVPDYLAYLTAKGTGAKSVKMADTRIRAFDLDNLSGSSVVKQLPANQQTARHYLVTLKGFLKWAISEGIIDKNPISHLSVSLRNYKPTFMRRSLTCDEIEGMLTGSKTLFRGLTIADRRMIYQTALNTGFRAKELGSLTAGQVLPAGLMLLSGDTKNRKQALQPLSPSFHATLSSYVCDFEPDQLIWPGNWWQRANEMLQRDWKSDADFHCLRVTYITELVRKGFYPKQVQILARHSTMELTMRYYAKLTPSDFNLSGLWQ